MKKIYSIAFAAVALFSAASCQKEMADPSLSNGGDFTITATTVADTKTVLDDDANVIYWTPGDKISVFNADNTPIEFGTDIIEKSTTAKFTASQFSAPTGDIVAIYPDATTADAGYTYDPETDKINNIRVQGKQNAVANSFDPRFGAAYAKGSADNLQFNNLHCLIKFTVADNDISSLTISGTAMLAGSIGYSINTGEVIWNGGATEVTLNGNMTVGNTYYIALLPNTTAHSSLKVTVGGKEVWSRDEEIELKPNKIYNIGSISMPEPPAVSLAKVWDAAVPFGDDQDRNMTMDSEYVYVAQAAGGNGAIRAISIADPNQTKNVKVTTYTPAGLDNGTHAVTCVRMLPNNDPEVNGGKDVLVGSNLTTGDGTEKLIVYVWSNGIDADPNYFVIDSGVRRLGDKFTVKGTYQSGELHFFDFKDGNTVIRVNMKDGVAGLWGTPELAYATGRFSMPLSGAYSIGEYTIHPDATFDGDGNPTAALLTTNSVNGFFTQKEGNAYELAAWGTDPNLTQTFGYNFFEHNGKDYIAYVKVAGDRKSAALNVIEDINGAADFKGTLEAKKGLLTAPVNGTGNASHGLGDCATVVIDGVRYFAVMGQDIGITLYKFTE